MKFKILEGSDTFFKLAELNHRRIECNDEARKIVTEIAPGESGRFYAGNSMCWGGGISGIEFNKKPKDWKQVYSPGFYFPKANINANKNILSRINNLPVVTIDELNSIIGYKQQDIGRKMYLRPTIDFGFQLGYVIFEIQEGVKFKPNSDMIEILGSEFTELAKKIERSRLKSKNKK